MCLGIPGRILEIWDEPTGGRFARIAFGDQIKTACLAYLPDLQVGDYTIVHAGFALTRLDEETAMTTLATMREYGVFGDPEATAPVSPQVTP
ncbi:hydrogenase assembly chaperone hypC/hupF [Mycolicibacterium phlei]|jgi:hydrogenase expression/formation protein HypC|uniref:Hydrogenase assembly protein HypC n=1 Tax=Mycolicibacterium phlei DSM 43239 = CCUG 21000 TaxID=1226750 RepID=A0A5N5UQW0_MYCPH|nr:HypC/HybG/HupF family hydrogenase formation chaperone [Mycolicibacterium phlei]VEG11005.1 hydrogenase assembly chaperone hypC/hupF [Mycobacteroides chelonae]AMO62905.1 hydrogenase 2 accessory protein HypG [Mycolicibacterium phlei]EID13094.1 hydrogenase assembly chaperone HypC/HupF [Mycolicibacterium phlei RIVM601174]KAB7751986.1 hydrogenase assembly protein HypC [Mycolicibacterium phlei DSM 43239 = CCUG 21000]KXW59557.1 hydrogenase assembly protein HypC [Mycolicibacterium phlei DSM 43072]